MVTVRKRCEGNGVYRDKPVLRRKDKEGVYVYYDRGSAEHSGRAWWEVQEFMMWGWKELNQIGRRCGKR